eukprot:NODE_113_length_1379_cov_914.167669_g91_i0.p1 GENE.NODE_113_length_1379_cov_914.167669_g91_i0~~NODE_113_length_1379_cov_914.167669_g91_i0.p1  ORF type:complete len:414 (-),score=38.55 NODE_113_length_1379_cov_914.167669_g91_i0:105-1346(-)
MGFCIVFNVGLSASKYQGMSDAHSDVVAYGNFVVSVIFLLEAAMKLYSWGMRIYFRNGWNRFDFVVVVGGILNMYEFFFKSGYVIVVGVGRLARIARMSRLITKSKELRKFFRTFITALPAILNICFLLVIIVFNFAYIGKTYLANIKFQSTLNHMINYRTFSSSVVVLLQFLTGDAWDKVMHDMSLSDPECTNNENGFDDCGYTSMSPVYTLVYLVIVTYVILSMFIAVILDNFSIVFSSAEREIALVLPKHELEAFQEQWNIVDKKRKGYIPLPKVRQLIQKFKELKLLIGLSRYQGLHRRTMYAIAMAWLEEKAKVRGKKKERSDFVRFRDVLQAFAHASVEEDCLSEVDCTVRLFKESEQCLVAARDLIKSTYKRFQIRKLIMGARAGSVCRASTKPAIQENADVQSVP